MKKVITLTVIFVFASMVCFAPVSADAGRGCGKRYNKGSSSHSFKSIGTTRRASPSRRSFDGYRPAGSGRGYGGTPVIQQDNSDGGYYFQYNW